MCGHKRQRQKDPEFKVSLSYQMTRSKNLNPAGECQHSKHRPLALSPTKENECESVGTGDKNLIQMIRLLRSEPSLELPQNSKYNHD